jgi:hypothetical protein
MSPDLYSCAPINQSITQLIKINCNMKIKHEMEFGNENLDRLISSLTDKGSKLSAEDQGKLVTNIREAYDKLEQLTLQYNDAKEYNVGL